MIMKETADVNTIVAALSYANVGARHRQSRSRALKRGT